MDRTIALLLFFVLVTFNHALFITFAKSLKRNNELRLRIWNIHYWVNGMLWFILAICILLIQFNSRDTIFSPKIETLGLVLCAGGSFLVIDGLRRLGFRQAMGYRFFSIGKLEWISSGVFSFLHNPIYDGFALIFLGLGLSRGIFIDFYLPIISFIMLNVFLASIESKEIKITTIL